MYLNIYIERPINVIRSEFFKIVWSLTILDLFPEQKLLIMDQLKMGALPEDIEKAGIIASSLNCIGPCARDSLLLCKTELHTRIKLLFRTTSMKDKFK